MALKRDTTTYLRREVALLQQALQQACFDRDVAQKLLDVARECHVRTVLERNQLQQQLDAVRKVLA